MSNGVSQLAESFVTILVIAAVVALYCDCRPVAPRTESAGVMVKDSGDGGWW